MQNSDYAKYVKSFGGRAEFEGYTIETLLVEQSTKLALEILIGCPTDKSKGVYVYGNPGSGKSHALKIKFNELYQKKLNTILNRSYDPRYPFWIETSEYLEGLRPGGSVDAHRLKNDATEAHWLFIDDLGATTKTEWAIDQIFQLIDSRLRNGRQTFITSNFNISELSGFYGERIASRICELCDIAILSGKDRRRTS